jgi:hypothetical protein
MKTVVATIVVPGPPVEAEQLWHDPSRWASWIDGYGHLVKLEGEWPLEGARRLRQSRDGIVSERVIDHRAGRGHTVFIEDERVAGQQRVRFEGDASATRVTVELDVSPKARLPPARRWWMRRKLAESLQRTLLRFSYELAAER